MGFELDCNVLHTVSFLIMQFRLSYFEVIFHNTVTCHTVLLSGAVTCNTVLC